MIKRRSFIFILISFAALCLLEAGPRQQAAKRRAVQNVTARKVMKRTAVVLLYARKVVRENKVYTGNLARAVTHQKYARKLFAGRMFNQAVYHSLRARRLALLAVKANKKEAPKEGTLDKDEDDLSKETPADDELDKEVKKAFPDDSLNDEDAASAASEE